MGQSDLTEICVGRAMNGSIQITAVYGQQVTIPLAEFPTLLRVHLRECNKGPNGTVPLEARGHALRTSTPMNWADLEAFIKGVCVWGGYAGISGRVLNTKNNTRT